MTELRCNQCWIKKPRTDFFRKGRQCKNMCNLCTNDAPGAARARRDGSRRRRKGLDTDVHTRFHWTARSGNRKLGGIPAVLVAPGSCPKSCPFWGRGCYAEHGMLGSHWRRSIIGIGLDDLIERVEALPRGQLWRYAVAGDLPGLGERTDWYAVKMLAFACFMGGSQGFTFTHKPLDEPMEAAAVASANRRKHFTINLSANSPTHADELADRRIGPVVVTLPTDYPDRGRTPAGRKIVVCPNETSDLTCERCRLCAKPDRKAVIGFRAHGQGKAIVSDIVRRPAA